MAGGGVVRSKMGWEEDGWEVGENEIWQALCRMSVSRHEERCLPGLGRAAQRSRQLSALSNVPECLKSICRAGAAACAGVRALGGWGSHSPSGLRHSLGSEGLRLLEEFVTLRARVQCTHRHL